jgi:hypothetical protein
MKQKLMIRKLIEDLEFDIANQNTSNQNTSNQNTSNQNTSNRNSNSIKSKKTNYAKLIKNATSCTEILCDLNVKLDTTTEYYNNYKPCDNNINDTFYLNNKLEEINELMGLFKELDDVEEKITMYGNILKLIASCTQYIENTQMEISNI